MQEVARAEDEQRSAAERQRGVQEIRVPQAGRRDGSGEQRARRGADLDAERQPAERGAARLDRHDHAAERIRERQRAAETERDERAQHEQRDPVAGERHRRAQHTADDELGQEQPPHWNDLGNARADARSQGRADGGDRDDHASRRRLRRDSRHVRDLERYQQAQRAIDELRDQKEDHDRNEVPVAQEVAQRRRAWSAAALARIERPRLTEQNDQRHERERAHAGRDVERRTNPEVRGDETARERPDGGAQELCALHAGDGDRDLVPGC